MDARIPSNYFPFSKGAILVLAIVLFFTTIIIAVYLWYDVRIEEINQTIDQLHY